MGEVLRARRVACTHRSGFRRVPPAGRDRVRWCALASRAHYRYAAGAGWEGRCSTVVPPELQHGRCRLPDKLPRLKGIHGVGRDGCRP